MFSLYRRHEKDCRFRKKGVRHTSCNCPVWMDGSDLHGKRKRRSMKTRSWDHAERRLREIEEGRKPLPDPSPSLANAVQAFLDDCHTRKLAQSTIVSYTKPLTHLIAFSPGPVNAIDLVRLDQFRAAREIAATTSAKELVTLRAFFKFCLARKWITENPAKELKAPQSEDMPTMPFSAAEIAAILEACGKLDCYNRAEIPRARVRARALVLLLLYSGFRISDAVRLARSKLDMQTGRLLVRMMKTRRPLYIKIPQDAIDALAALPVESLYFFWSGRGKLSSAVGSARRTIDTVTKLAKIDDGHPHRFRDTFSVELLDKGADIRTVQLLLGHKSLKTTERHYAPFVASTQRKLDDAVALLHFSDSRLDAHPLVDPKDDALGDAKDNLLPFARAKRS